MKKNPFLMLLDENNNDNIVFYDENNNPLEFEQVALINLDEQQFKKYVHGEELDNYKRLSGYACVMVKGAALGGVKCTGNKLKNLYPKGLRF